MDIGITGWIIFNLFVLLMLFIDLVFFHKKSHQIGHREALVMSAIWIVIALLFCLGIYFWQGSESALNFLAGYLLEKSLSVDNLFVFLTIFTYFATPKEYLHKVLFWGVLGALVMRGVFIFTGIALIEKFHWIIYLFGAFLIYTGYMLVYEEEKELSPEKNVVLKLFRRFFSITPNYEKDNFFVKIDGKYWATPLFVVLIIVETTDILFAVDSVPAILAITSDPFIVYTSNVFAILGLRALYFALESMMQLFHYLNYGLAALLVFIGVKMLLSGVIKIPILLTLFIILTILTVSIIASIIKKR